MGNNKLSGTINLWAMSGEIGFLIAVPLVFFVLVGIKIDRYLGTMPLFIIIGMFLAMAASSIAIARKIKALNKLNR